MAIMEKLLILELQQIAILGLTPQTIYFIIPVAFSEIVALFLKTEIYILQ